MWGAIINLRNNLFDDTLHQFQFRFGDLHVDWRFNRRPGIDSRSRMMASWAICGEVGGHVCEASPEFPYFCVNFASFLLFSVLHKKFAFRNSTIFATGRSFWFAYYKHSSCTFSALVFAPIFSRVTLWWWWPRQEEAPNWPEMIAMLCSDVCSFWIKI